MSDNKKYYYLKLKENFFDTGEAIALESMPDGMLYTNILLKLYLRSLNRGGCLMLTDRIPYNSTILAKVVRQPEAVVKEALNIFQNLGLVEILDTGEIYMLDIQNYIGESSTEADRKREYRNRIEQEKASLLIDTKSGTNVQTKDCTNVQTNLHHNRDRVKDKDKVEKIAYASHIFMTEENYNHLIEFANGDKELVDECIYDGNEYRKDHKPKSKNPNDYTFIKNWLKRDLERLPKENKPKTISQEEQAAIDKSLSMTYDEETAMWNKLYGIGENDAK